MMDNYDVARFFGEAAAAAAAAPASPAEEQGGLSV